MLTGKWNYTKTILDDWLKRKLDTVDKVQAEDLKFKKQKSKNKKTPKSNFQQRDYADADLSFLYKNKGVEK